jgi:hypothetical protein
MPIDTRELMRQVGRLRVATRRLVDQRLGGEYHSVFKGQGIEFDEVREYDAGDDARSIDWNVTARMGRPFVKRFTEERELTVMLVVDASSSGDFGTVAQMKGEVAVEVCALLAFSAIKNQDRVGLIIFTDRIEKFVPPKKGRSHVLRVIRDSDIEIEEEAEDLVREFEILLKQRRRGRIVRLKIDRSAPESLKAFFIEEIGPSIYNQAVADMESTALALFAVREAVANKCLPAKTTKPSAEATEAAPEEEAELPPAVIDEYRNGGLSRRDFLRAASVVGMAAPLAGFIAELRGSNDIAATVAALFPGLPAISIDYALMESADRVLNIEASFDWDDVGSWISIAKYLPKYGEENRSNRELTQIDSENNIVFNARPGSRIALLGVDDLIIVQTEDALLIAHRRQADAIKDLAKILPPELL